MPHYLSLLQIHAVVPVPVPNPIPVPGGQGLLWNPASASDGWYLLNRAVQRCQAGLYPVIMQPYATLGYLPHVARPRQRLQTTSLTPIRRVPFAFLLQLCKQAIPLTNTCFAFPSPFASCACCCYNCFVIVQCLCPPLSKLSPPPPTPPRQQQLWLLHPSQCRSCSPCRQSLPPSPCRQSWLPSQFRQSWLPNRFRPWSLHSLSRLWWLLSPYLCSPLLWLLRPPSWLLGPLPRLAPCPATRASSACESAAVAWQLAGRSDTDLMQTCRLPSWDHCPGWPHAQPQGQVRPVKVRQWLGSLLADLTQI
jgi:hypothetical protein